jgi:3-isopropylmalate/(R)-2-methylmalate dehydratase small subunit
MSELRTVRRIAGIVSTDDIIPARYKHMYTAPEDLAPHLLESFAPQVARALRPGDVLVSDSLFGIGSSREQAVTTMMASGISMVLAPRFGRILFRNCWNLALPAIELDTTSIPDGAQIAVDLAAGIVRCGDRTLRFPPPSNFLLDMVRAGGLLNMVSEAIA